jgi:hypothetical protein
LDHREVPFDELVEVDEFAVGVVYDFGLWQLFREV